MLHIFNFTSSLTIAACPAPRLAKHPAYRLAFVVSGNTFPAANEDAATSLIGDTPPITIKPRVSVLASETLLNFWPPASVAAYLTPPDCLGEARLQCFFFLSQTEEAQLTPKPVASLLRAAQTYFEGAAPGLTPPQAVSAKLAHARLCIIRYSSL